MRPLPWVPGDKRRCSHQAAWVFQGGPRALVRLEPSCWGAWEDSSFLAAPRPLGLSTALSNPHRANPPSHVPCDCLTCPVPPLPVMTNLGGI